MIRWQGEPDPDTRPGRRCLLVLRGRARHERLDVHSPGHHLDRSRRGSGLLRSDRRHERPAPWRCAFARVGHDRGGREAWRCAGLRQATARRRRAPDGLRTPGLSSRGSTRASVLRRTARELSAPRYEVAEALEQAALAELRERRPDRVLETNVEFWAAIVLDFAKVPATMFTSMFTCARSAGWSAHILEQKRTGRLIRPSAIYTGPRPGRPATLPAGTSPGASSNSR